MSPDSLTEQIEAYLLENMSQTGMLQFEQKISANPELRKEVEKHRKAHIAIQYMINQDLKEQLNTLDLSASVKKVKTIPLYRKFAVAASILIILGIGAHFWASARYDDVTLANQFFAKTEYTLKGELDLQGINNTEAFFKQAELTFLDAQYTEAIGMYQEIIKVNPLLRPKAEWNLLMCYASLSPYGSEFNDLLDTLLKKPDHPYHQEANKFMSKRQSMWYRLGHL